MNTLASLPLFATTTSAGCGPVGQPGSAVMSSGFVFGAAPLKLITPLTLPAVAASIVIVAGFGVAAGCSEAGCDLLQPRGRSRASKTVGTKERIEMALTFVPL